MRLKVILRHMLRITLLIFTLTSQITLAASMTTLVSAKTKTKPAAKPTFDLVSIKKLYDKDSKEDINAKGDKGWTLLHHAALANKADIVAFALTKGAQINAQAHDKSTPLIVASQVGAKQVVTLLVEKGADINARMTGGFTALHLAAQQGQTEVVKILIAAGADKTLLSEPRGSGLQPIHLAALGGHVSAMSALYKAGVSIDALTGDKKTPLLIALAAKQEKMANLIVNTGANLNASDAQGLTALMILASSDGSLDLAKKMVDKGAKLETESKGHATVLDYAKSKQRDDLVKFLESKGAK